VGFSLLGVFFLAGERPMSSANGVLDVISEFILI
jgi:hypothetical protein